jgi:hypothetical protein
LRPLTLALGLALAGCVAHAPLGDDWDQLGPAERDARATMALEELFRGEGAGAALDGRQVERVDLNGVRYRTGHGSSHLRWEDIESVQSQTHEEIPTRPETIHVYLRQGSTSEREVLDLQEPLLASVGIARRYVLLHRRPRWSRVRLLAALEHARERREKQLVARLAGVAPVDSATPTPAPSATPAAATPDPEELETLDDVEAKLRKLKEWHEAGLITPEEYAEKRQQLLSGM